jgi:hypothetical protein
VLAPEVESALRRAAADPARGRVAAALHVLGRDGRRVHAADLHEQAYLGDYEVEIAQKALVADPTIDVLRTGSVLDVRAVVAPGGKSVALDAQVQVGQLLELRELEDPSLPAMRLQLPARTLVRYESTFACPDGRTVLAGVLPARGPDAGRLAVLLLRAAVAVEPLADLECSVEGMRFRLLNVLALTRTLPDHPMPSFDLQGEADGPSFVPPDAEHSGAGIAEDGLETFIRQATGNAPWEADGARLFIQAALAGAIQSVPVLDVVEADLARRAAERHMLVSVDVVAVDALADIWRARREGALAPEALLKEPGSRLAGRASLLAVRGLQAHAYCMDERTFVRARSVEIAQESAGSEPDVDVLREGFALEVRATPSRSGKTVRVEARVIRGSGGTLEPRKGPAEAGATEVSRLEAADRAFAAAVPAGAWAIAAESEGPDRGGAARAEVVFIRALPVEAR